MNQAQEPESSWKSFFHGICTGLSLGIIYGLLNYWTEIPPSERNIASEKEEAHLVQK